MGSKNLRSVELMMRAYSAPLKHRHFDASQTCKVCDSELMESQKLIVMFGSKARGTAGKQSDTDIAVLADHLLTRAEKNALSEHIAEKLGISDEQVDLIDLYSAPPLLAHQVGETGTLIEGTTFDFNRFRIRAWKQYLDTAKFRRAREKSLINYVQGTNT